MPGLLYCIYRFMCNGYLLRFEGGKKFCCRITGLLFVFGNFFFVLCKIRVFKRLWGMDNASVMQMRIVQYTTLYYGKMTEMLVMNP